MTPAWLLFPALVVVPVVGVGGIVAPALSAATEATVSITPGLAAGEATAMPPLAPSEGHSVGSIPPAMLALYRAASLTCPGLQWQILAGIGTEESGNGTSSASGVHSGANYAGAEGPMQFEPPTFAEFDQPVPAGGADPPSPYDPTDAVYAAARMLCADGGGSPTTVGQAIYDYNHSASYVAAVVSIARSYGYGTPH